MSYLLAYVTSTEHYDDPRVTNESLVCTSLEEVRAAVKELASKETNLVTYDNFEVYTIEWDEDLDTEICEYAEQVREEADLERSKKRQAAFQENAEREKERRRLQFLKLKAEFEPGLSKSQENSGFSKKVPSEFPGNFFNTDSN